jgi:hypothetical protein
MGSKQITLYQPIVTTAPSSEETALIKQIDRKFDPRLEQRVEKLMAQRGTVTRHNATGIFFPDGYVPGPNLDLIVYFHGLLDRCGGSGSDTVEKYWTNPYFRLRELVNAGKKNVVLVVPHLVSMDKTGSKLGMDFTDFLSKVLGVVGDRIRTDPFNWVGHMGVRRVILAAHSGGGLTMLRWAQTDVHVDECWGFDSMYQAPEEWVDWAAQGGKYFLFWTDEGGINTAHYGSNVTVMNGILNATKGPKAAKAALARPNIVVEYTPNPKTFSQSTKSHCEVPRTYWAELMKRLP